MLAERETSRDCVGHGAVNDSGALIPFVKRIYAVDSSGPSSGASNAADNVQKSFWIIRVWRLTDIEILTATKWAGQCLGFAYAFHHVLERSDITVA